MDTARVGVVVRLGTVEPVFGGLGGAEGGLLSAGERAARGALPPESRPGQLLCSVGFAYRSQLLFSSPVLVSSILCSPPGGPAPGSFLPAPPLLDPLDSELLRHLE